MARNWPWDAATNLNGGQVHRHSSMLQTNVRRMVLDRALGGWLGHANPLHLIRLCPRRMFRVFNADAVDSCVTCVARGCGKRLRTSMAGVRAKSLALSGSVFGFDGHRMRGIWFHVHFPRRHTRRGSQLSFARQRLRPIMQTIIDKGVIGDFRAPICCALVSRRSTFVMWTFGTP